MDFYASSVQIKIVVDKPKARKTPPKRGLSLLHVNCKADSVSLLLIHKHLPVIHGTDAAAELGMPVAESLGLDDLLA